MKSHPSEQGSIDAQTTLHPFQMQFRWVMLVLVWMVYTCFGIISQSNAPLVTPIMADLKISYTQMGSILGAWQLTYIIMALVAGLIIDRVGMRKSLGMGSFIIALSAIFRSMAADYVTLFLAVAVFGIGGPLISIGAPKVIALWFEGKDRKTAAGLYMTGPAVGAIISLSTINTLIMPFTHSWRTTFLFLATTILSMTAIWWLLAREASSKSSEQLQTSTQNASRKISVLELLRLRNVWLVVTIAFSSFLTGHGINNWLPKIFEMIGMTPADAGLWVAVPNATGIVGAIVLPKIVSINKMKFAIVGLLLGVGLSAYLLGTVTGSTLMTVSIIYGVFRGAMFPMLLLILMETPEVGSRYMGTAGGLFFTVGEIGGFSGPFVLGIIADISGSFYLGVVFLTIVNFVMIPFALMLKQTSR